MGGASPPSRPSGGLAEWRIMLPWVGQERSQLKKLEGEAMISPARSRREGKDKRETELLEDSDSGPLY